MDQHLDYVDDICLFAHKIPELFAMDKSLEVVAASASLTTGLVQVGVEQIEAVDKFTYLGSEIDASGGTELKKPDLLLVFCLLFGAMRI